MPYDGDRGVCYAYIGGADRTPDILFAQVYSLQSIKYPTGAREELVYELNTYPDTDEYGNAISSYAGGLRIYSIQCRDVEGTLKNERRFLYEKDGIPTGYAPQVTFVDEMEKLICVPTLVPACVIVCIHPAGGRCRCCSGSLCPIS